MFFVGLGLMLVTYVATEFTYGVPERIAIDFGLGMLSLSSLGISLFLGVNLISKEIDSRTVYMVISRPVPRFAFIIGKIIGLMGIQLINVLVLSFMTLTTSYLLGGEPSPLIFWAILFCFIESLLLLLLVVFIALMTNNVLAVIFSLVLLFLGHAIKETQELTFVRGNEVLMKLLDIYHFVLPAFHKMNIKEFIIYNKTLPMSFLLPNLGYGVLYSLALLFFIIHVFNNKNID